jgi:hypothetical protein
MFSWFKFRFGYKVTPSQDMKGQSQFKMPCNIPGYTDEFASGTLLDTGESIQKVLQHSGIRKDSQRYPPVFR